ncbi:hypothetical protein [Massilia sp. GCM10023247]|uniref:hypothetical protein n=1 Tax=Massilia sp. GCM10023247 TaxID=3252643 RepID=UPI003617ED88
MDIRNTRMDPQERRTDLRRRAIFTLLMLAGGSALLAAQDDPARQAAPRLAAGAGPAGASPLRTARGSYRPFNATAVRPGRIGQPSTPQQWKRSTP